jgi:hypothetical protein
VWWRKPEFVTETIAASALEENELKQAAGNFLRETPQQLHPIGVAGKRRPLL